MSTPDQQVAHELFTDLQNTIATQALPYQHGIEQRALDSLYEVFKRARASLVGKVVDVRLARIVARMLNTTCRPFMARWHVRGEHGLLTSRDGGDLFRSELAGLQRKLRRYAGMFHLIAYGAKWKDAPAVPPMTAADMDTLFAPIPFGIPPAPVNATVPRAELNASEKKEVSDRRSASQVETADGIDAVGLAFSGGGIRSATFCLGVAQILARKDLLKHVDFLSTVSGGGYTGSFLTQVIGRGAKWREVAAPHGPDTDPIRRLRQRAKYIMARNLWDAWGMVTATVAGMFMNWMMPLLVLVVLAALTATVGKSFPLTFSGWSAVLEGALACAAVSALAYYHCLRAGSRSAAAVTGWLLAASVAGGLLVLAGGGLYWTFHAVFLSSSADPAPWGSLHTLYQAFLLSPLWHRVGWSGLSLGAIAALIPAALRYLPFLKQPLVRKIVTQAALVVAAVFIPVLGVLVFLMLCSIGSLEKAGPLPMLGHSGGQEALWLAALCLTVVAVFFLNINLTGPHRLYRSGLSQTFVELGLPDAPYFPLANINASKAAPYHLLNAAVNLPSSDHPGLRERLSDFFLFSKHWTGSPVVGYEPTDAWKMNGDCADLASAMAISGAAFSANMGLGSIAPLRALLAFLNVRLGFWIRVPNRPGLWGLPKWKHPGFGCLLREMTGLGMSETHRWLNLSDGGHIENLAVYELLRRRCKFIVAVDGEADPGYTFQGLLTLVRHAQIDFGVRIEPELSEIIPDPKTLVSRSHFHLCRISYPTDEPDKPVHGLLLYLKLSVTGNESALIKRYRQNHLDFPHQTTLDQFFDEEQFEAYRQLGVHVAEGLFKPALLRGGTEPVSVATWFRALAESLLEPIT